LTRGGLGRGWIAAVAALVLGLAPSGCSLHRKVQPYVFPPFTAVELAQSTDAGEPPMIEAEEDQDDLPPVPVAEGAGEPKRQRRRPAKAAVAAPPPDAPAPDAAPAVMPTERASIIGEFTPGGDQNPGSQKEASDLIAANERRLSALSPEVARVQAALVSNVRNFQKQAQQALRAGDAAGAKTLATKSKLLLDDLEKGAGV